MDLLSKPDGPLKTVYFKKMGSCSFRNNSVSPSFESVMAAFTDNLKKIGVKATYRTIDPALYTDRINNFDFDMCVYVYGQSQSPGNEQRNFWQSDAADRKGSRNLAGIKNEAVEQLIEYHLCGEP